MERARIDDVRENIKHLTKKQQENVMLIAKTHGVTKRFLEIIDKKDDDESVIDMIQLYIDEMKQKK
ncbi:hypothetical protein [Clostridium sp. SM-530-WT-3G]|uniref:hypothetical protein n=1 Tax=Clostridium sp. SM-530-WT-3G TaxID=2725303 RepID=UPI00145E144B|nr:hypothetical protein [Clostridium sp. SM-530-WT-3G]NME81649.1 hypothetical protein [Clostridium sp. SM-530-WT-3G]